MTELHSHVIYGIDDGAKSPDSMYALLEQASDTGVNHLICTSHITPGYNKFPQETYLSPTLQDYSTYDLTIDHFPTTFDQM